ncbi:hypothetical protein SAMN04489802_2104 [Pseudomonas chlororaphis]|uniref:hypothetical protein n=1 Tax=Pseudomonas chlororaphis TaxID=587753 RepID=UPI00087C2FEB|nr:hypothetical protein [Pseudomonas chlororaphis]AZD68297.1 DNA-directed RNA polymerase beta subunit [Pseudomonas chlororaphis subsp. aurantiaca]QIT24199.1 hypothetical protein HCN09_21635 [Pseudomonas chlororaphis subsp. aurantiaca]WDH02310.1 hypothetical protein PUP57_22765 [Pseudomonas chlororaphis]WDH08842.1 hypothetical protein PUP64_24245 [Pseudomonas chlororaphis]SDS72121.1 hypothetical protein SAMN04489802_2104 [Pseudomonas chlororaphis]
MQTQVTMSSRHYLSISHLSAASLFAERSTELEPKLTLGENESTNGLREHNACIVSTIMLSAAFLEATINEFFSDCAEDPYAKVATLPTCKLMAKLWSRGIPKTASYSILEKYEIALDLNEKQPFDKSSHPYQDVKLLVELRNALIHYEPETIQLPTGMLEEQRELHKFEKKFRGKFELNSLTGAGNAFYPDKMLGSGCARWAVKSAVALTDTFYSRFSLKPMYDHVRAQFSV